MNEHYSTVEKVETKCTSCGSVEGHDVEVSVRVKGLTIRDRQIRDADNRIVTGADNVEADVEVELTVNDN